MENINYNDLRIDVLRRLIDEKSIECKDNKKDMVAALITFDEGKYYRETTYTKDADGFIVGIDMGNKKHLSDIAKLTQSKEARCLNRYCDNRLFYYSNQKLL